MKNSKAAAKHSQELLSDLQALGAEATALIGDSASEHAEDMVKSLREKLDLAQERFSEFYGDSKKRVTEVAEQADDVIRANPYQTLLISAGVCLVLGVLIGRATKTD